MTNEYNTVYFMQIPLLIFLKYFFENTPKYPQELRVRDPPPPGSSGFKGLRLFVSACRVKLQPSITDQLKMFPISKEWMIAGRPCSPRVLFIFENHSLEFAASNGGAGDGVDVTRSKTMVGQLINKAGFILLGFQGWMLDPEGKCLLESIY